MRLIDADELKEEIKGMFCPDGFKLDFIRKIDNAPTVEYPFYQEAYQTGYEEGKNERPQGEWITSDKLKEGFYICSNCKEISCCKGNYCCDCGADMRGKEK